ncbi:hypothetical protein METBIDRAFT_12933 [Metschnikowia bicuspidata var. bicuspidata NRRL YB-4993]|uniref:RNI-like protein n=1 Tax=Metschnikowia bicuspidata var. bicuspidata NRRL YB-4993 TaxID=869754 RepID=A0A1A0H7E6_9ASCO|nr:hypothetical protein METBIDRAFT_12933 [Metschnikowia bicuspidata var. bicuspidata NRRL YB-4993]OBA19900.1 hypothetical protein METBIDRAFT_12933 [Metschnikowia bicuspidata var. bicuspidata NRRL YB-4993]
MFGKRKYDRKKGVRKSFRRRRRKKGKILKLKEPEPVVEKPVFSASGSSLYLWMHVPPLHQTFVNNTERRGKFTSSLRERCAEIVGANSDALSPSYLEEAPWSCWQSVWSTILKNGSDLPELFRMFARRFGDQISFSCHASTNTDVNLVHTSLKGLRNSALNACLIPFYKKHRVENVFSNISINDFVTFVSGLDQASIAIDCSKMPPFTTSDILSLCNIPSLRALDLSGNRQVDDQLLYTIKSRLTLRESNLQILVLSGCPYVTEKGLFALLKDCGDSKLSYVEADLRLLLLESFEKLFSRIEDSNDTSIVTGTQWRLVRKDDKFAAASKYKLGLKFHFLLRQSNDLVASKMLWDIKFFSAVVDPLKENVEDNFVPAWKQRYLGAMNRPLTFPFAYMKDIDILVKPCPAPVLVQEIQSPPIFERAGRVGLQDKLKSVKQNTKKPRTISTNAQAFFFGG